MARYYPKKIVKAPVVSATFPPSRQQQDILNSLENSKRNLMVIAGAGCAKTSTIVLMARMAAKLGYKNPAVCMFGKAIQLEAKAKLGDLAEAMTLHSYGFKTIANSGRVVLDKFKGRNIAVSVVGDDSEEKRDYVENLIATVSKAKNCLASSYDELDALLDRFSVDVEDRDKFISEIQQCMTISLEQDRIIDYDDMIWFPVAKQMKPNNIFDLFCIDETQDLSPCQIKLALMASNGGRIVAVGDPNQAIFQFRGADMNAVDNVRNAIDPDILPLNITYRCGKSIVAEANVEVPELVAFEGNCEGEVSEKTIKELLSGASAGDYILSRVNAPMLGLCMRFIREGKKANISGRDVGANLNYFIKKSKCVSVTALLDYVETWSQNEIARLSAKNRDTTAIEDKAECLRTLCDGANDLREVKANINSLFVGTDDTHHDKILLSTTHKAKGGERNRVWMLNATYDKIRNRANRKGTEAEKIEEKNISYVSKTRAKNNLFYVRGDVSGIGRAEV